MDNSTKSKRITGHQLAATLSREIIENAIRPGMQLPTSRELAKRFMVSAKTVDRAVRNLAQKGLVERVPGKGTFVKNNRPECFRSRVAVIYLGKSNFYLNNQDMQQAAFQYFYDLLLDSLTQSGYRPDRIEISSNDLIKHRLPTIDWRKYDVVISTCHNDIWREMLIRESPVPVIFSNDETPHPGAFHQAYYDFTPGFRQALEAALKRGFRKFFTMSYISTRGNFANVERLRSIFANAKKLGIPRENIKFFIHRPQLIESPLLTGVKGAEHIIKNDLLDHLIIVPSDFVAYGMQEEFSHCGLIPGKDYHLISYDNTESRNPSLALGVTSITHPLEQMVDAILQIVENVLRHPGEKRFYCSYQVPAQELVFRQSFPDPDIKKN